MDAVAEGEVLADLPVDVEAVPLGVAAVVAIGRAHEGHHARAPRPLLAVVLDVPGDVAGDVRRGWLVAEDLLDRVRDQRRVLDELPPLIGMGGEYLAGPRDQPRRRLVCGPRDHVAL